MHPRCSPSSPLTLVHLLIQLNLKGSGRLLNPRVVQTRLEVPVLGFLDLPGQLDSPLGERNRKCSCDDAFRPLGTKVYSGCILGF